MKHLREIVYAGLLLVAIDAGGVAYYLSQNYTRISDIMLVKSSQGRLEEMVLINVKDWHGLTGDFDVEVRYNNNSIALGPQIIKILELSEDKIRFVLNISPLKIGTYEFRFSIFDRKGNSNSGTLKLEVVPKIIPEEIEI